MVEEEIVTKENKFGIEKQYVKVQVGTSIVELPRHYRNPLTDRTHDVTKLSDDGYLKNFLALDYKISGDFINLRTTPVLSFDKERWKIIEKDNTIILEKKEPKSKLDQMVLED